MWDIPVQKLCNKHLLAQHAEIHAIYNIITKNKKGYANHPEVNRWRKHLGILNIKHDITAHEILERGFKHNSNMFIPTKVICGFNQQSPRILPYIQSAKQQIETLRKKGCSCDV